MVCLVVTDIGKVLPDGGGDADCAERCPKLLGKAFGVAFGAGCRAEARHSNGDEVSAREAQQIKRFRGYKHGKRGVQSARNAHNQLL